MPSFWNLIFTFYSCMLTTEALNPALMPLLWKQDRSLNHMVAISAVRIQSGISLLECGRDCGGSAGSGCSSFSYEADTRRCFLQPVLQAGASGTYLHFVKDGDTVTIQTTASNSAVTTTTVTTTPVTTTTVTTTPVTTIPVTTTGQTTATTVPTTTTAAASSGSVADCATKANYTYLPGNLTCIKFMMVSAPHASMKNMCLADGGRPLRVESASKLTDLVTILVQFNKQYNVYWLDATDTEVEGIFYWGGTSSTPYPNVASSALFENGEPNNGSGGPAENCLALSANQKFTDRVCLHYLFGICELTAP